MSDADYYNYGQNAYAGTSCAHQVAAPVPAGCWGQVMSSQTAVQQPAYAAHQSHAYTAQPQQHTSYVVQQAQPVVQSYQTQPVHNYEQAYTQGQPVYTTGGYGSHAGSTYQVPHQPLRGFYGVQPKKHSHFYVQGYAGANLQHSSDLSGISGAFTTGNIGDGTTIDVADGTEYGWETEFDTGSVLGAEIGYRTHKGFRIGLEGTRSEAGVEFHEDITLGGTDIAGLDGATLVGDVTPLGATIGDFLADGQGDIEQKGVFLNGYYDFNEGGRFRPYIGAGVGVVDVDVEYAPSGSPVIDASETVLGYQGRVGASYNVTGPIDVFGEYTYRATEDLESDNLLFTGTQELKNSQSLVTVGARYNF